MSKDMLLSFLKKTAYAVIGNVVAALMLGLSGHLPTGSPLELQIYGALAAVLTGAIAALKRWADQNLQEPEQP
jgi:hypothetical protein